MGMRLESFRGITETIKDERENIYEDFSELSQQKKYLDILDGLAGFSDITAFEAIRETDKQHRKDFEGVLSCSEKIEDNAESLTGEITGEIHRAESILDGLERMSSTLFTVDTENEKGVCREHIEELKKLLAELESNDTSSGEYDFFSESSAKESRNISEIRHELDTIAMKNQYFSWSLSLSSEESEAISSYVYGDYETVNGYLRGSLQLSPYEEKRIKGIAAILHDCLSSAETERDIKVYCSLSAEKFDEYSKSPVMYEPAFLNASFECEKFSGVGLLELSVPAGSCGMSFQEGFILDRNQVMRIDRIERSGSSGIIHASLLQTQKSKAAKNCPVEGSGGHWEGRRGNSAWIIDSDYVPSNTKMNPDKLSWRKINEKCGTKINRINFRGGYPDFSEIAKFSVEIEIFASDRTKNFLRADSKFAEKLGITKEDAKKYRVSNGYTWHELQDCKTMLLVPSLIHNNVKHRGGIAKKKISERTDLSQ